MIEHIEALASIDGSEGLLATIVSAQYRANGATFLTDSQQPLQVGYLRHPAGHLIEPHRHLQYERKIYGTQEVLVIRSGRIRVDFYTSAGAFVCSRTLGAGDVLILCSGGHGFTVVEEVEILEVKTGPYLGRELDKVVLRGVNNVSSPRTTRGSPV